MAKVYEYVVVLSPTKDEQNKGVRAKIMSGTAGAQLIVADSPESAKLEALIECAPDLAKLDQSTRSRVEVLVRPFV